jgi:hypothetical protein
LNIMRLQTISYRFTGQPTDATRRAEAALAAAALLLALLAALLPATALPAHYHDFADQRAWLGLPHAMDVLSNLPFAALGVWGLVWLRRLPRGECPGTAARPADAAQRALAGMFFVGLLLTTLCSSFYHWAPGDAGLCIDRMGMSLAFAGLLGLAAADRVSARAGLALAALVAVAAPAGALIADLAGNMTPWAVLQGGALALLAALALRPPRPRALGFSIGAVIALYLLAKALELADAPVFALTRGLISGHSAKHISAALAAWPVVRAVQRACMLR